MDALNRVSVISDGASQRAVYTYVGAQRRSQVILKNGANTVSLLKMSYDGMARVTSARYRNAGDTATIVGFEHDFDKTGTPKYEVRTHQAGQGDAYMYDKLSRVTRVIYDDANPASATYAVDRTEDFGLDLIGNRASVNAKSATPTAYLHNPVNEYTKVGGADYLYDASGNLTRDANHLYHWDYENRLTKVQKASDSADVAAYAYDATRRRIEKIDYTQDPAVTTRFYHDNWSEIEERDAAETLIAAYINGPSIDNYVTMERNGNTYWYCQSPIVGNVAALLNSAGVIQEGYTYTAYGQAVVRTAAGDDATWFTSDDTMATASAIGNPFTFTGRRLDSETCLHYFRMRMYSSVTGSFVGRDPLGYVGGMSLFEYVRGAPTSTVDPHGLWPFQICPFGNPTHEGMSLEAAGTAGYYDPLQIQVDGRRVPVFGASQADLDFVNGLRQGSIYPDAPDGVPTFLTYFADVKAGWDPQWAAQMNGAGLTYQSHFGDRQYWHGMATPGMDAKQNAEAIENWLVGQYQKAQNAKCPRAKGVEIGKALHTIQDLYDPSHTSRVSVDVGGRGTTIQLGITRFQSYGAQDAGKHDEAEDLTGRAPAVMQHAAGMATFQSAVALNMLRKGASPEVFRDWLTKGDFAPLRLESPCECGGSEPGYLKKKK